MRMPWLRPKKLPYMALCREHGIVQTCGARSQLLVECPYNVLTGSFSHDCGLPLRHYRTLGNVEVRHR